MLEIKPVEDKEIQKKYCEAAGVTYVADALAYMAFVNTMETGFCQFGIKGNVGYIYSLTQMPEKDDTEALFIMARAALSFMALCGAEIADVTDACVLSDKETVTYSYYQKNIKPAPNAKKKGWVCKICGYVYEGEELPEDFTCPLCKHPASDFERL